MVKKGLSDIVSTLLILLLVFVAIAIVWLVVRNVIKQGTEQISLGKFTLDLQIEQVSVNENSNSVNVKVKRNSGEGEFVGLKFIISDEDNSEVINLNGSLNVYEKKDFILNLDELNSLNIKKIQIAPIFKLSSGKEVAGDVKDTWEKTEDNLENYTENTTILCTSDLNCTADYNSTDYYCYLNTNNVYKTFNDYSCSGGVCVNNPTAVLVQVCNSTQTCSNGICVNNAVNQTCPGSSTQSCTITNGIGSQSRTCTNGVWSNFGTCTVVSCNNGYVISGNSCVVQGSISLQALAFPEAEGYGRYTRGAYSGSDAPAILIVDSLEAGVVQTSDTSGSFEWAVTQTYPRIVIFKVGGDIDYRGIKDEISITSPYLSVYGQTAPFPGIIIHGVDLSVRATAHDTIIQHIKSRPGGDSDYGDVITRDAFSIYSYNVILDHCSASFATDEQIALSPGSHDVTVSNCIVSHPFDETSSQAQKGVYIDGEYNLSFVKNLIAYNRDRSPSVRSTNYAGINNMNYIPVNFIASPRIREDPEGSSLYIQSHVGNYYVLGVSTAIQDYKSCGKIYSGVDSNSVIYFSDNICQKSIENPGNNAYDNVAYEESVNKPSASPLDLSIYNIIPASDVQNHIVQNAGAFNWQRDNYDSWVITHVQQRDGGLANSYADLPSGALQYYSLTSRTLSIPLSPHGDTDGDGYTNIEEWVHEFVN